MKNILNLLLVIVSLTSLSGGSVAPVLQPSSGAAYVEAGLYSQDAKSVAVILTASNSKLPRGQLSPLADR